jgi:hypothetical protein
MLTAPTSSPFSFAIGVGNERAVRTLRHGLDASHRPLFPQSHRHRTLVERQLPAVGRAQAERHAPLVLADLRLTSGKFDGGAIEIGDLPGRVRRVHGRRQRLQDVPKLDVLLAGLFARLMKVRDVHGEAARVDEPPAPELHAGCDLDVPDRAVPGAQPGGILRKPLAARQPRQDVVDRVLVGVKLGNVPSDIVLGLIAEQLQLRLVRVQDDPIGADQMQRDRAVLEEVLKVEPA